MNRQDSPKRRKSDKRGFPTGLVTLGLLLVALVWLSVFRPHVLDSLSLHSASSLFRQSSNTVASVPALSQPDPAGAQQTTPRQILPATAEATNAGSANGAFYRYTDEQGVIHLVDNPDNIPAQYRRQVKIYRDTGPATRVRIVNNRALVPVTLHNGGRTVQATLVLDTGCSVTSISAALAARLGIDPARTSPGTARMADGRSIPTSQAVIDQLTAGPKTKAPLEVSVMAITGPEGQADGLLGMNFLRDFRYQLDVSGQQIHWR
jgi:hypothetical protein